MSTVDKIMALADECTAAAAREGYMPGGFERARDALRAAIVEALDMGKPVGVVGTQASHYVGGHIGGQVFPWTETGPQDTVLLFKKLPQGALLYAAKL